MRLISSDFKKGTIRFKLDQPEDSWHLLKLVQPSDLLFGRTERKIKLGNSDEKGSISKKIVWLEILVEKTSIDGAEFRANGTVTEGLEDIPKGSHQSISLSFGEEGKLTKKEWSVIDRQRLKQAVEEKTMNILAVVFDREEATLAKLTTKGFDVLFKEAGDVQKKGVDEPKGTIFQKIAGLIKQADDQHKPTSIILASPAFWKEYLMKELPVSLQKKCILATISSTDSTAFSELVKRPELQQVLANDRMMKEEQLIDEALVAVRKDEACYGKKELEEAAISGNLKTILISENILDPLKTEMQQKIWAEGFLEQAEKVGAEVFIITQDACQKKLNAFSHILGIKRWKTTE